MFNSSNIFVKIDENIWKRKAKGIFMYFRKDNRWRYYGKQKEMVVKIAEKQ